MVHLPLTQVEIAEMKADDAWRQALRDDDELRLRGIIAGERTFDPHQPRNPHSGEWIGNGAAAGVLKDALKLAGRIDLRDGEHLAGSGRLESDSGTGLDVVWAAIDGPQGREVRLGTVFDVDAEKWRAANKGSTASLSTDDVAGLRDDLTAAEAKGRDLADKAEAVYSSGDTPTDPVLRGDEAVASGRIDSPWGPVTWNMWLDDSEPTAYQTSFKVGADESADSVQLSPKELRKLISQFDGLVQAA